MAIGTNTSAVGGDWDSLGNNKLVLHVDSLNLTRDQRRELLDRCLFPDQEHHQHTRRVILYHIILHTGLYHGQDYAMSQLLHYEEWIVKQANSNLQVNVIVNNASQSAASYLKLSCPGWLLSSHIQLESCVTPDLLNLPLVHRGHVRPRRVIHTFWTISLSCSPPPSSQ